MGNTEAALALSKTPVKNGSRGHVKITTHRFVRQEHIVDWQK